MLLHDISQFRRLPAQAPESRRRSGLGACDALFAIALLAGMAASAAAASRTAPKLQPQALPLRGADGPDYRVLGLSRDDVRRRSGHLPSMPAGLEQVRTRSGAYGSADMSPLPSPNVRLTRHGIGAAGVQLADGSLVMGGNFRFVNGQPRQNLVKLRPDGTVDPHWQVAVDGHINAIARAPDGAVYIGGLFETVNGIKRPNLAKLSPDGTFDVRWKASLGDGFVETLAVDAAGDLFVGGRFASIAGQPRNALAKVDGDTAVIDPQWRPVLVGVHGDAPRVQAIKVRGSALYVGGSFSSIGGIAQPVAARIATGGSGAVDASWRPVVSDETTVPTVSAFAIDEANDAVFLAGAFTQAEGGVFRLSLSKVSLDTGAADPDWRYGVGGGSSVNDYFIPSVHALDLDGSGGLYVAGDFDSVVDHETLEFVPAARVVRLATQDGALDPDWSNAFGESRNGWAYWLAWQPGRGALALAGDFGRIQGQPRDSFATLTADAALLPAAMSLNREGTVTRTVELPDRSLIACGLFSRADGIPRSNLVKLTAGGKVDAQWAPGTDGIVMDCVHDGAGGRPPQSLIVGGDFSHAGGVARGGLAKVTLAGVGALDAAWDPQADGMPRDMVVGADGMLYVAGWFSFMRGQRQAGLAKIPLAGDGVPVPGWNPIPHSNTAAPTAGALALSRNGSTLYVGGTFFDRDFIRFRTLGKIDAATGVLDPVWTPTTEDDNPATADGYVEAIAVDGDNAVYVGGPIYRANGQPRRGLAKFSGTGSGVLDPTWNPGATLPVNWVWDIFVAYDRHVYVAGEIGPGIGGFISGGALLNRVSVADGTVDLSWTPSASDGATVIGIEGTRRGINVGGYFHVLGGATRLSLGTLPSGFLTHSGPRRAAAVRPAP